MLCALQAFNLWLQYISLLGLVNIPAPRTVQTLFNVTSMAFTTISSGILSLDCLLTGSVNRAVQRMLIHLALPLLMLLVLSAIQLLRYTPVLQLICFFCWTHEEWAVVGFRGEINSLSAD